MRTLYRAVRAGRVARCLVGRGDDGDVEVTVNATEVASDTPVSAERASTDKPTI